MADNNSTTAADHLADGEHWRQAYVEACGKHALTVPRTRTGKPDPILITRRAHADVLTRYTGELRAAGQPEAGAATAIAEHGIVRLPDVTDHEQVLRPRRLRHLIQRRPAARRGRRRCPTEPDLRNRAA